MAQKSKVLVCDRPFKCPVCRRDFVIGDEILLLLPQRTRYCSDCGKVAIARLDAGASGGTVTPPRDAFGGHAQGGPVTTTAIPQTDHANCVSRATLDKVIDQIDKLQAQVNDLDSRLSLLE